MIKAVRIATVGAALAGSVVLLQGSLASASPTGSGGGHPGEHTVLTFDVEFSPFHLTDPDRDGPTPGDTIVFNDRLLVDGSQVGHEVGSCVVVDVPATGPLASCTAVVTLDGGTITYALENSPPPRKVLAVTGGSGEYRSAGGEGVLVENGDGTGTLTLDLDLDLDD